MMEFSCRQGAGTEAQDLMKRCTSSLYLYSIKGIVGRITHDRTNRLGYDVFLVLSDSVLRFNRPADCWLYTYIEERNTLRLVVPYSQMGEGKNRVAVGWFLEKSQDSESFRLSDQQGVDHGVALLWNYTTSR